MIRYVYDHKLVLIYTIVVRNDILAYDNAYMRTYKAYYYLPTHVYVYKYTKLNYYILLSCLLFGITCC